MVIAGVALVLLGLVCQWVGICPIVKRVWTSSYTLYSGGLVVLILAGFYALMECKGWQRWAFPLVVVGMNSIAIYVMSWTMTDFFGNALDRHFGRPNFSASPSRFRHHADLLVHPLLDVPPQDLLKDLRDPGRAATPRMESFKTLFVIPTRLVIPTKEESAFRFGLRQCAVKRLENALSPKSCQ
jgi:hypothetical protein